MEGGEDRVGGRSRPDGRGQAKRERGEAGAEQATVPHRRLHHPAWANRDNYRK
jgi:hypothetical protein